MNRLHNAKEIEEDDDSGRVRRQISQCEFVAFLCIGIDLYSCTKHDVPTGALDTASGKDVLTLFGQLHGLGNTIVMITHDLNVAKAAGRIVHIIDGCLG